VVHGSALHSDWGTAGCKVHTNFAICLLADNVWNERKLSALLTSLTALFFTVNSAVHAWEFVCYLSAVGGSYQLH
jgi:hypothetical protein